MEQLLQGGSFRHEAAAPATHMAHDESRGEHGGKRARALGWGPCVGWALRTREGSGKLTNRISFER